MNRSKSELRDHGFTLVELLVVIGIIAVLISLLLPAITKVRSLATMTKCMSNHRQIMLSLFQYTNEYDNKLPPQYHYYNPDLYDPTKPAYTPGLPVADKGRTFPWYHVRFLGRYTVTGKQNADPTKNDSKISMCPALGTGPGYDRLGIGMNACWNNGMLVTMPNGRNQPITRIREPGKTLMFVDVQDPASTGTLTSYLLEQLYRFDTGDPGDGQRSWDQSGRVVAYRHNQRTVASFADGHAEVFSTTQGLSGTYRNQGLHAAFASKLIKYKMR